MERIITATVQDTAGVLNRVTNLMTRRGYNISSITVGGTHQAGVSKMTFVLEVTNINLAEQVVKQLNKQINVLKVQDITDDPMVIRELALIKVQATAQTRAEINTIIAPFRAIILDVARSSLTVQVTGKATKVNALIEMLEPYGIKDIARTGVTAFPRG